MSDDIVKSLLDKKGSLNAEMRSFAEECEKKADGWSAEDDAKWQRMNDEYDRVSKRANDLYEAQVDAANLDEQRAKFDDIARPAVEERKTAGQTDEEKLRAFLAGETRSVEFKVRPEHSPEHRVHTKVTAASGGTTVPREFVPRLYDYLWEASPIRQLATVITTDSGQNMDFPVVASQGTAAIVGEGTALPANDATFSTVTLGAWKYGKLTQISLELANDSGVDLLEYIAKDAGRAIALAQGEDFSLGTGTNEPLGYGTAYSIGVTGATGGTGVPSIANLVDLFYSVSAPYRNSPSCAWVARDASVAYIRKLAIASTAPEGTWATNLQAGQPDNLLGKPFYADPFSAAYGTPAKPISFGDWSTYLIRDVGTVRMERSDDFAFDKDLITFRTALRTDAKTIDVRGVKHFAGPST